MMPAMVIENEHARQIHLRADSVDISNRSVSAVVATESMVDVFDHRSGRVIAEVLLIDGAEFPAQAPLLTDHNRSVISVIGSVAGFNRAGSELKAMLRFARGTAASDEAWSLVEQKHLRDVSVGYCNKKWRDIPAGRTENINGRSFTAPANRPLRVVSKWEIKEVSLVPIGADQNSGIRSANQLHENERGNTMLDLIGGEVGAMTFARYFDLCARERGQDVDRTGDDLSLCRSALSQVGGVDDMLSLVNQSIIAGFQRTNDTTTGWSKKTDLPDFLEAAIAAVDVHPRLEKIGRNEVAPSVGFGVSKQGWRLARFACQFQIDEMDMMSGRPINIYRIAMEEIGQAARRLVPDLVFSLLLTNAALDDGTAAFDVSRSNYATAALDQASLDAGLAAVANQIHADEQGDPVHISRAARYLTVPPDLYGNAKRLARAMQTGDGDIIVRAESRLGTAGVVNPSDDTIVEGSATNWMLSCPSDQAAGVVVGSLNGRLEPKVRHFKLKQGEWGMGFDVVMDIGATVLDAESLYWSTGTV